MNEVETYGYMYDSAENKFPADSRLNMLYFNGRYAHKPYEVRRGQIWIDVLNDAWASCSVLDVETGDATPADVPGWLEKRNPIGRGVIYCNRANFPLVCSYAKDIPFNLILATLDGTMPEVKVPHGSTLAYQIHDLGDWDQSAVVNESFWNTHAL
jgi:hypothetical protein